MPKPGKTGNRLARRIGLFALVMGVALAARAANTLPAWDKAPSGTAAVTPLASPAQKQADDDARETVPDAGPAADPMEDPAAAITFSDADMEPPAETQAPPVDPTQPPGVWSYADERIQVDIRRYKQDDFVYFAADIQLSDPSQFSYAFSHEKYGATTESLSDIAERHSPLVAVNGDYYSFHNNGIIIRGGELFRKQKSSRHLLIVDQNGDLAVMTDRRERQADVARRLMDEGVLHTFEFGPVLVEDGQAAQLASAILRVAEGYLEPRTAIGQLGPLHYLVIVVDGRSPGYSEGCDLPTLQQLFLAHGVSTAFNLDGGGSTTLWFDGEVINEPSSGDERKVSDIVMFLR